jgi:hypothetical protein
MNILLSKKVRYKCMSRTLGRLIRKTAVQGQPPRKCPTQKRVGWSGSSGKEFELA